MKHPVLVIALSLFALPPAFALDAACEPIIKASEGKIAQPAWHHTVEGDKLKLEFIKLDGQFYMNTGEKWQKSPTNMDEAEKASIEMLRDSKIKISDCKDEGTETLGGMEMNVLSYTSETPGMGAASKVKQYFGKEDGLAYKAVMHDEKTVIVIRYKDIVAPRVEE